MRICTCGAPASLRFSRPLPSGTFAREDRCGDCGDDMLTALPQGPAVTWEVADLSDDLIAAHSRLDARNRRGEADTDLMLLSFGSDY